MSRFNPSYTAQISQLERQAKIIPVSSFLASDYWGDGAITLFGDSISWGAMATDVLNDSWAGILRKFLQVEYGMTNYGYVHPSVTGNDIHTLVLSGFTGGEWTGYIGNYVLSSSTVGSTITITVPEPIAGFKIHHSKGSKFQVSINSNVVYTYAGASSDSNPITDYIDVSSESFPLTYVITKHDAEGTMTLISGFIYYTDNDKSVFNNYSRSGLHLTGITDETLQTLCNTKFCIFALGHNDSGASKDINVFQSKLDICTAKLNEKGARLVVIDFIYTTSNQYKTKLKAFADTNNGRYIDVFNDIWVGVTGSSDLIASGKLADSSHPTEEGHKDIAEYIAKVIGLGVTSKDFAEKVLLM